MKEIKIITSDQYEIVGRHFPPEVPNNKVIVINSGSRIKQSFYIKYATFISQKGYDVITYGYRRIVLSRNQPLKGFDASMTDWTSKDLSANETLK